jgi:hypothetical protein
MHLRKYKNIAIFNLAIGEVHDYTKVTSKGTLSPFTLLSIHTIHAENGMRSKSKMTESSHKCFEFSVIFDYWIFTGLM